METRRIAYANARDVLPRRLLRVVQGFFQGALWVPVRARRRFKTVADERRNARILEDRRRGLRTAALAERHGLSPQRIRQIVRGRKRKR